MQAEGKQVGTGASAAGSYLSELATCVFAHCVYLCVGGVVSLPASGYRLT